MAIAAIAVVDLAVESGLGLAARWAPTAALAGVAAWAVFWSPSVEVCEDGPRVRNVLTTWIVPWAAIQLIDTKYSLTLVTAERKIIAFAAPASGRLQVRRAVRSDVAHLPESTYGPGRSVRPGDLPSSPSGQIAIVLRERWQAVRDAGGLAEAAVPVRLWHTPTLGILAALAAAAVGAAVFLR
jgi:hypothetical protein